MSEQKFEICFNLHLDHNGLALGLTECSHW